MKKIKTNIDGLFIIQNQIHKDNRGLFFEAWNKKKFQNNKLPYLFVQDNISISKKNVIRGLHFQNQPYSQIKFIQVLSGKIIDIAVDIRKNSKTFGKHVSVELSQKNNLALLIPTGFAHGFISLEDNSVVMYKCDSKYMPNHEHCIQWNDKELKIDWGVKNPIVSLKDQKGISLREYKINEKMHG